MDCHHISFGSWQPHFRANRFFDCRWDGAGANVVRVSRHFGYCIRLTPCQAPNCDRAKRIAISITPKGNYTSATCIYSLLARCPYRSRASRHTQNASHRVCVKGNCFASDFPRIRYLHPRKAHRQHCCQTPWRQQRINKKVSPQRSSLCSLRMEVCVCARCFASGKNKPKYRHLISQ